MHVQEHDPEEDSLGTVLYDAGMDEERVSMWQHAERMVLLGEGLSDYIEELRSRHRAPEDVWDMILCAAHESGRYQAATMCMQEVSYMTLIVVALYMTLMQEVSRTTHILDLLHMILIQGL